MKFEVLHDSTVLRLRKLLKSRYGTDVKLNPLLDVSAINNDKPFVEKNFEIHIPIVVNDTFLSTAVVDKAIQLKESDIITITHLVKMVLDPILYNWYLEHSQKLVNSIDLRINDNSKIIPLYEQESPPTEIVPTITNLIFLQGENPSLLRKVAIQIHEMTERWALVNFNDISSQTKNTKDISNLGSLSIFVQDVLELQLNEVAIVNEYLDHSIENKSGDNEPLIIVAGKANPKLLADSGLLNKDLARKLYNWRLEVDKVPLNFATLRSIIEMMYIKSDSID